MELEHILERIAERERALEKLNEELKILNEDNSALQNQLLYVENQAQAEIDQKNALRREILSIKEEVINLQQRILENQKSLSSLSILAFGKKKDLRSSIDSDQALLEKKSRLISEKQNIADEPSHYTSEISLSEAKISENSLKIKNIQNNITEIESQLAELHTQASSLSRESTSADTASTNSIRCEIEAEIRRKLILEAEEEAKKQEEINQKRAQEEAEMRKRIEAEVRAKLEAEKQAKEAEKARLLAEEKEKARREAELRKEIEAKLKDEQQKAIQKEACNKSIAKAVLKLEAYYPEHKVFALDSIDSKLRENLSELYKRAGYATLSDLLDEHGFEIISNEEVKEIRNSVIYTPGNEPECIKNKISSMLSRLEEYYPDHIISRGMQNDHKKLSMAVSGLYQWLGYESGKAMLSAYGFEQEDGASTGGRPENDYQTLIDLLVAKYKDHPKPRNMGELIFDNPDYKAELKTLQNKSNELFGMSLKKYLSQLDVFEAKASAVSHSGNSGRDMQNAALSALKEVYDQLDPELYGSYDDALNALETMTVKQNKAGQIYIFRGTFCKGHITIPYGIDFISAGAFRGQSDIEFLEILAPISEISAETFSGCSRIKTVQFSDGLVSIGEKAFANCTSLETIAFPASLQQIGEGAFNGCISLKNVTIPNNRIMVRDTAFEGCQYVYTPYVEPHTTNSDYFKYSLDKKGNASITAYIGNEHSVTVPGMIDGHPVTTIAKNAFLQNNDIAEVILSDYISTVQGNAFQDCSNLRKVHLSNSLAKIVSTTFNGCSHLREINIPDPVTEIKKGTFKDSPIEILYIGKSLSSIDTKPFFNGNYDSYTGKWSGSRAIAQISIDSDNPNLTSVGSAVFSKDKETLYGVFGAIQKYAIPSGVKKIADYAFEGLKSLTDVEFPDSLVSIGAKAFSSTSLRSIALGPNLKTIGAEAFSYCEMLTAAVFSPGLEEIWEGAFIGSPITTVSIPETVKVMGRNCFSLTANGYYDATCTRGFHIDSNNPYWKSDGSALYSIVDNGFVLETLYGPQYREDLYFSENPGTEYICLDGTTEIAADAFGNCTSLTRIVVPEGVMKIGARAFSGCDRLEELSLPATLEFIDPAAFENRHYWNEAFRNLKNIEINELNSIFYVENNMLLQHKEDGTSAVIVYWGNDDILVIPNTVSGIYSCAFYGRSLSELHLPASLRNVGENAFSRCKNLTHIKIALNTNSVTEEIAYIYIPEAGNESEDSYYSDYVCSSLHDQAMDCIREDGSGGIFDFVKYDSLFETYSSVKDKILVAVNRLKSNVQLVPQYRDYYLSYLQNNAERAVEIIIAFDDIKGLSTLKELNVFTGDNINSVIDLASKSGNTEILSYLMNYKNSAIGTIDQDFVL